MMLTHTVAAIRPEIMGQVLGIVYRTIATHLINKAGRTHKTARTGAVTLMMCMDARIPRAQRCAGAAERFGSPLKSQ